MPITDQTLTLYRGTDPLLTLTATAPGSYAGWTAQWNLRQPSAASPVLTVAAVLVDSVNGVFTVQLSRVQTLGLTAGMYSWDLSRIDGGADDLLAAGVCYVRGTAKDG